MFGNVKVFLLSLAVLFFGYLFFMARRGDALSIAILASLATLTLFLGGLLTYHILQSRYSANERERDRVNIAENVQLLALMAKAQAAQSLALTRHQGVLSRLPEAPPASADFDALSITDGVFAELD